MSLKSKKNIAIDFDGVIHKYSDGFQDGTIYDSPVEGAREAVVKLAKKYNVIIFTTRLSPIWGEEAVEKQRAMIKEWLEKNNFSNIKELTGVKPVAMYYIDDRAVRFASWEQEDIKLIINN